MGSIPDITEHRIRGQYADYVIKRERGVFAVVEKVKPVSMDLNDRHLYQAVSYAAANEGIDWVILTNGDEWRCYRVLFGKPVDEDLLFSLRISHPALKPKYKAELPVPALNRGTEEVGVGGVLRQADLALALQHGRGHSHRESHRCASSQIQVTKRSSSWQGGAGDSTHQARDLYRRPRVGSRRPA